MPSHIKTKGETMYGIEMIAEERRRQIEEEGWTAEHDEQHADGELAWAAVCYAAPRDVYKHEEFNGVHSFRDPWPWRYWDKREKHDRIRQLVIAGALIAAELDRLDADAEEIRETMMRPEGDDQ